MKEQFQPFDNLQSIKIEPIYLQLKITIMKTKLASLLVVFVLVTTQCMAQKTITVEAQSTDISNNLDLQAVSSAFGESTDLADFERRLNDYDSQISNLDLNKDGEVDYLRVVENTENNVHVVVIQAVLDKDVYQDVATIVVEKNNNKTSVQVIGDPYIYGEDYIIEPVYVYTPSIFSFFWGYNYHSWYSPYYWGYYPNYYRNRNPYEVNYYMSHINSHINRDHHYYYSNTHRDDYAYRLRNSVSRNDYATRYPDRTFSRRNDNIRNKNEFNSRSSLPNRSDYQRNESVQRNPNSTRNNGTQQRNVNPSSNTRENRNNDDIYQNRTTRNQTYENRNNGNVQNGGRTERNTQTYTQPSTPQPQVNRNSQTYTQPSAPQVNRNPDVYRNNQNNSYQRQPSTETRQQPSVNRENNNTRQAPVVNQQPRQTETRSVERSQPQNNTRESSTRTEKPNRSSNNSERK